MKMQLTISLLTLSVLMLSVCDANHERQRRSPDKFDDHYEKFIAKHFSESNAKYIADKDGYKNGSNDNGSYEVEESAEDSGNPKDHVENHDSYKYTSSNDYERIKALSEAEVAKLQKNPENCKYFDKDGMICASCKDPHSGDTSESCAYSSDPHDKKVAYLSKKSHNYKKPTEEEESSDHESETIVTPSAKVSSPAKQYKSEMEDAGDYSAYKLANYNSDVEGYGEGPKFAHLKVEPKKNEPLKSDFEMLPNTQFKARNLNQALTDFQTKDWSKCSKIIKGDMTCYHCKDAKGATQEECMYVSSVNPKNIKLERREISKYGHDSNNPVQSAPKPVEQAEQSSNGEKFARLRMARPLAPTKASLTAEPLVTPKILINSNPADNLNTDPSFKKTIKRTATYRKRISADRYSPIESRVNAFESHVHHV